MAHPFELVENRDVMDETDTEIGSQVHLPARRAFKKTGAVTLMIAIVAGIGAAVLFQRRSSPQTTSGQDIVGLAASKDQCTVTMYEETEHNGKSTTINFPVLHGGKEWKCVCTFGQFKPRMHCPDACLKAAEYRDVGNVVGSMKFSEGCSSVLLGDNDSVGGSSEPKWFEADAKKLSKDMTDDVMYIWAYHKGEKHPDDFPKTQVEKTPEQKEKDKKMMMMMFQR